MIKQMVFTCVVFVLCAGNVQAFDMYSDSAVFIGTAFSFGNAFEYANNSSNDTYLGEPGFDVTASVFSDESYFGWTFRISVLFPVIVENRNEQSAIEPPKYKTMADFFLGGAARLPLSERLTLTGAFGISCNLLNGSYELLTDDETEELSEVNSTRQIVYIGFAIELGLKINLTQNFYLNTGSSLSWFPISNESVNISSAEHEAREISLLVFKRSDGMLLIKPYLGIGFTLNIYRR